MAGAKKVEKKIIRPQKGFQEDFLSSKADIAIGGGSAGGGKLMPFSEPVLTPDGWKMMGDIEVDDYLMCPESGDKVKVLQTHKQKGLNIYKLTFSDGTFVKCCEDHLWKVQYQDLKYVTVDVKTIINTGFNNYSIDYCNPINFKWQKVSFSNRSCAEIMYERIDDKYIYNSKEIRLRVLLMFSVRTPRYNGKLNIIHSNNNTTRDSLIEIIRSLGGKADLVNGSSFATYKLPSKNETFKKHITNIEFDSIQDGQCVYVDSDAHLYVANGYNATHNTFALLLDPLYDIDNPTFGYTYFRRNLTQIKNQGGLWDEAINLYSQVKPAPTAKISELKFEFPSGAAVKFAHLEYEKDIHSWQGSQLAAIAFDELTHFSYTQFTYLLSRNRSVSGAHTRVRATCNPDPDSWVAKFIDWWIDDDGYPIPERCGKLRYFLSDGGKIENIKWGNTKKEVIAKSGHIIDKLIKNSDVNPEDLIKSVTFIPGSVFENKALLAVNPGYLGGLAAQDEVNKARLLDGNWKVKASGEEMVGRETIYNCVEKYAQKGEDTKRAITADVAMKGGDKMVVMAWDGFHLMDITVVARSNGREVVEAITGMMRKWHIEARNVVYDGNNMGSYIDGFIPNSREFLNNARPKNEENYGNLKSQCADKWAMRLNNQLVQLGGGTNKYTYSIDPKVANRKFGDKTVIEHLGAERRAVRWAEGSIDGKYRLIPKSDMKQIVGHSPDFIETWFMLEFLYLDGDKYTGNIIW